MFQLNDKNIQKTVFPRDVKTLIFFFLRCALAVVGVFCLLFRQKISFFWAHQETYCPVGFFSLPHSSLRKQSLPKLSAFSANISQKDLRLRNVFFYSEQLPVGIRVWTNRSDLATVLKCLCHPVFRLTSKTASTSFGSRRGSRGFTVG